MLKIIDELLWGPGTLALLLGTGIFLNVRMRFLPWRNLPRALRSALGREARQTGSGGVSSFSALMTTLAATLGTGNIVGVSTALAAGGPGALVWMEVSALLGMSIILAESTLAVKYRKADRQGGHTGGPMYVMEQRLGRAGRKLGLLYALFAALAGLGIGSMTQANAAAQALDSLLHIPPHATGAILSFLALLVILGGIRSISKAASVLVPVMAAAYLAAGIAVILVHWRTLPSALSELLRSAFSFRAAAGGAAGIAAMRWGIARGVYSNEAGLGSSGIAAAAADSTSPVGQGYISMTGPFFDTVVMCTVTGLAVCCSGVLGMADGAALTMLAFGTVLGSAGETFVTVSIVLFAFSTIIGWEYLGETAFTFLTRRRGRLLYRVLFALAAFAGAAGTPDTVFRLADICNALMCLPNLICLLALSGEVSRDISAYERIKQRKKL